MKEEDEVREKLVHKIRAVRYCGAARVTRIWNLSFLVAETEGKPSN